ncbi:hypothetical protein [Qipengyuania mesophila]|uniref:C-type cytochrome biogenesis protein CcmI n=1 Tax=Qipengyuania mesophila TaxID=2867246 RepID=A0ABS7JS52_9SPHN|nr:hypothetical protein [Qipengyuania mesophila]MBX7500471.1 hypothetical protein [Qipengyuania mesophila]
MSFWTAIVLLVLIGSVTKVLTARYRAQHGITADRHGNENYVSRTDPGAQREIEDLRERIKVLERIATDGNSLDARETKRIAAEIEALRDKQAD